MIEAQDQPAGFEIGTEANGAGTQSSAAQPSPQGRSQRRSLPVWAVGLLALVAGIAVGSILNSGNPTTTPNPTPVSTAEVADAPRTTLPGERSSSGGAVGLRDGQTLIIAELSGADRVPTPVTLLTNRSARTIAVTDRLAGPTTGIDSQTGRRVLHVGGTVLFVGSREVFAIDTTAAAVPTPIVPAVGVLRGSGPEEAWLISSTPGLVHLFDVADGRVRATYDLSAIGEPLDSFNGGLVVAPAIERFGVFAVWSPARGIERLWSFDDQAQFVASARNVIVVNTSQGLSSYNTVTGALTQTRLRLTRTELTEAFIAPDGAHLAVLGDESGDGLVPVTVIDLRSGMTVDEFSTYAPWLLDWASNEQILYRATMDQQLQLRHVLGRFATTVVELDAPINWAVVGG